MTIVTVTTTTKKTTVVTAVIFAGLGACPENLSELSQTGNETLKHSIPPLRAEDSDRVVW